MFTQGLNHYPTYVCDAESSTIEVHLKLSEASISLQGIKRNSTGTKKLPGMCVESTLNNYRYLDGLTVVPYLLRLASGEDAAVAQKVFSPKWDTSIVESETPLSTTIVIMSLSARTVGLAVGAIHGRPLRRFLLAEIGIM